jgi:tRNA (adenine22-N1)-methyltransferase
MSERLRFLLSKARAGSPLWDIGCDHGYLAESACFSGLFPEVHFVDPVLHQIEKIRTRLAFRRPPQTRVFLHALKGEEIQVPIEGTVVLAGIGGATMFSVLSSWNERGLLGKSRLVLSPHKDLEELLENLKKLPFVLVEKTEVQECGRLRPVLVLDHAELDAEFSAPAARVL